MAALGIRPLATRAHTGRSAGLEVWAPRSKDDWIRLVPRERRTISQQVRLLRMALDQTESATAVDGGITATGHGAWWTQ